MSLIPARSGFSLAVAALAFAFLGLFLVYPLFNVFQASFFDPGGEIFTLSNYAKMLGTPFYRAGLVKLFPKGTQARITETLDDAGEALRLWLGGQLLAMIMVGFLIAGGLALVGVPSALALGLIAGVTEFVPIVGPVIGAIPALLLASTQDWNLVVWTLAVFVVVQQIESNLIMPLVAGRAVAVPPAVGLFAVVAIGVLFGPLGLLLGYPLAIVTDAAVRRLYVRETLGEEVEIAGEKSNSD